MLRFTTHFGPARNVSRNSLNNFDYILDHILHIMNTTEFQEYCAKIVKSIDAKYGIERTPQLSFTQLMEEVGELAQDINSPKLRGKPYDEENLKGEFADVFLQLCVLADMHNINFEESVELKLKILKDRHGV